MHFPKKIVYNTLLVCLLFLSPLCQAKPTILVVGDSLSAAYQIPPEEGWVALLEEKLKSTNPEASVINSSIVGDTTANGLNRLPALLEQYHPDIVILELGGNDGLRGLPPPNTKENLSKMIELSLKAESKVLLIGMRLPPNYGQIYIQQFEKNYSDLSTQYNTALVPFMLEKVALKPGLLMADKIHPVAKAQPLILETIWPYLEPLL